MTKKSMNYSFAKKVFVAFSIFTLIGLVLSIIPHVPSFLVGAVYLMAIISLILVIVALTRIQRPSTQDLADIMKGEKSISEIEKTYPVKVVDLEELETMFFKKYSTEIEEFFRDSLGRNPNDKELWEKLCYVLMIKQNINELIKVALDGLDIFKNNPKLLGFLALAYEQSKQKEKANDIRQKYEVPKLFFYDLKRDLKKVKKWMKSRINGYSFKVKSIE